jgi:TonB-dependent SusC/RagA subfamily outer membrane receptor
MKENLTGLDEIVVVGYGTLKKRELTGAISSVKSKDLMKTQTSDFASAIQGRMAGVSVRQGNAAPGENATITIRGITSFQDGGSGPLYVVDGVTYIENPNITPQEIESIEVLKDGASAAIYGSRASGGVILITTKKGKEGQMKVSFDSYYGVQNITSGLPLANTLEALYIKNLQYRYDENDPR